MTLRLRSLLIIPVVMLAAIVLDKFVFSDDTTPSPSPTITPTRSPSPTPTATATATPKPTTNVIKFNVPFMSQSPLAEWSDPRQQDACEEASVLMAMHWVRGQTAVITAQNARNEILALADWQKTKYNNFRDTSTRDTAQRLFVEYHNHSKVRVEENITADDIIDALEDGNLVIVPADGQALKNPHFTQPGPERHMLVVIGYDPTTKEFITNDPGTRLGQGFRYGKELFFNAIRNYSTSQDDVHLPIVGREKTMIVVSK